MMSRLFSRLSPVSRLSVSDDQLVLPRGRCAGFLVIDHLQHRYGYQLALADVSLTVAPGEILCLLGASGCGKSTLLRMIAGVEQPDAGRILLDGREVSGPNHCVPPEQRGVGLVFQDYALFPHLSVIDNVMFGLGHLSQDQAQQIALRALKRVALDHYANDYPHQLSGGEQQRVALARALAPRPSVILMDEPFSNLDQRLRETIRQHTIDLLRDEGISAVIVTHDPEEALQLADTIALMDRGRIVQTGTPEQLFNQPDNPFVLRFFCDVNEIEGISQSGEIRSPLGTFTPAKALPDGPCLICLRPESLRLANGLTTGQGTGSLHKTSDQMQDDLSVKMHEKPLVKTSSGLLSIKAHYVSRRFLGLNDRVRLQLEGYDQGLSARLPHLPVMRAGDSLTLWIDPADLILFSR